MKIILNLIRDFFWFCSGINREILLDCKTEYAKYASIGATVFFTAIFAGLSSGYAMYYVFSNHEHAYLICTSFGILWSVAIFNLDRFLVMSVKKGNGWIQNLGTFLPRLFLAFMIGIVIARPLELRIFEKEINEELAGYYRQKLDTEAKNQQSNFELRHKDEYSELIANREQYIILTRKREVADSMAANEEEGTDGPGYTGDKGRGVKTIEREKAAENIDGDAKNYKSKIDTLEARIDRIKNEEGYKKGMTIEQQQLYIETNSRNAGFILRNKMLSKVSGWPWNSTKDEIDEENGTENYKLPKDSLKQGHLNKRNIKDTLKQTKNNTLSNTIGQNNGNSIEDEGQNDMCAFFISLLFVIFECMPLLVKIMSKRGTYDAYFEEEEKRLNYLAKMETSVNSSIVFELAHAQRSILSQAVKSWKKKKEQEDLSSQFINEE